MASLRLQGDEAGQSGDSVGWRRSAVGDPWLKNPIAGFSLVFVGEDVIVRNDVGMAVTIGRETAG